METIGRVPAYPRALLSVWKTGAVGLFPYSHSSIVSSSKPLHISSPSPKLVILNFKHPIPENPGTLPDFVPYQANSSKDVLGRLLSRCASGARGGTLEEV